MTLKIISPQSIVFTGEVKSVTLPGEMGRFTVLHDHASLISTLVKGKISFTDIDGVEHSEAVERGIVSVDNNIISVCIA